MPGQPLPEQVLPLLHTLLPRSHGRESRSTESRNRAIRKTEIHGSEIRKRCPRSESGKREILLPELLPFLPAVLPEPERVPVQKREPERVPEPVQRKEQVQRPGPEPVPDNGGGFRSKCRILRRFCSCSRIVCRKRYRVHYCSDLTQLFSLKKNEKRLFWNTVKIIAQAISNVHHIFRPERMWSFDSSHAAARSANAYPTAVRSRLRA